MENTGVFATELYHPYAVQFSPFFPDRLACCACKNYGISGPGVVYALRLEGSSSNIRITCERRFNFQHAVFHLTWSEDEEFRIFAAAADGNVISVDIRQDFPVSTWRVHENDVCHIDCSTRKDGRFQMLTASWDKSLATIDSRTSTATKATVTDRFFGHTDSVYCGVFAPLSSGIFASASRDGTVRVWDTRSPVQKCVRTIAAHPGYEALTVDWSKYDEMILASGGTDGLAKIFDLRFPNGPASSTVLTGHKYAVRRLKWSPFSRWDLLTCSYDSTVRLWRIFENGATQSVRNLDIIRHHTEFVYGVDYNLHTNGRMVADCAWDRTVKVYFLKTSYARL